MSLTAPWREVQHRRNHIYMVHIENVSQVMQFLTPFISAKMMVISNFPGNHTTKVLNQTFSNMQLLGKLLLLT